MSQFTNEQKLNDIIFADRNKEYGAYVLRSNYGDTVFKSLSLMILGVGSIMSAVFYLNNRNNPETENAGIIPYHDTVYVIPVNLKKEEAETGKEKKETPPQQLEKSKSANQSLTIADSTFEKAETSTVSIVSTTTAVVPGESTGSITGTGPVTTGKGLGSPDTTRKVNEGYEVDIQPEFEGGLSALYRFVSKNLKYPNWASVEGKEGTVFVKFVVDENGKVGSLSLLNTAGYGMDEEAFRVVSLIPKFKTPARAGGKAVKVYYQMPIRFRFRY